MTAEDEAAKKPRPNFESAIEAVCKRYGFSDWAVIARKGDRSTTGWWVAGDGRDPVDDNERALLLHARMAVLQDTIIAYLKAPRPI